MRFTEFDRCPGFQGFSRLTIRLAYATVIGMHATIYGRGQMVISSKARKEARIGTGDAGEVQPEGNGRIVLLPLDKPQGQPPKVKIAL
jgi:hypothetical protein